MTLQIEQIQIKMLPASLSLPAFADGRLKHLKPPKAFPPVSAHVVQNGADLRMRRKLRDLSGEALVKFVDAYRLKEGGVDSSENLSVISYVRDVARHVFDPRENFEMGPPPDGSWSSVYRFLARQLGDDSIAYPARERRRGTPRNIDRLVRVFCTAALESVGFDRSWAAMFVQAASQDCYQLRQIQEADFDALREGRATPNYRQRFTRERRDIKKLVLDDYARHNDYVASLPPRSRGRPRTGPHLEITNLFRSFRT